MLSGLIDKIAALTTAAEGEAATLPGVLKARIESDLSFRVAGRIERRLVDVGAIVKKRCLEVVASRAKLTDEILLWSALPTTTREANDPTEASANIGFRCAATR